MQHNYIIERRTGFGYGRSDEEKKNTSDTFKFELHLEMGTRNSRIEKHCSRTYILFLLPKQGYFIYYNVLSSEIAKINLSCQRPAWNDHECRIPDASLTDARSVIVSSAENHRFASCGAVR